MTSWTKTQDHKAEHLTSKIIVQSNGVIEVNTQDSEEKFTGLITHTVTELEAKRFRVSEIQDLKTGCFLHNILALRFT